jgi:hypothetical protein
MKALVLLLTTVIAASAAEPAPKKPTAKPRPRPGAPAKKTVPKPQPSIGDLALAEAKKADENHDGKITGTEVSKLRGMFSANPKSWLYIYDDNGNKMLDDQEIGEIKWSATPPPNAHAKRQPKGKRKQQPNKK